MKMNKKGVIGLPLRLAMTFLILSLSVPVVVYMVEDLRDDSDVALLRNEASKISDTVSKAYYSGEGGMFTVDISVKSDCVLTIGGEGKDAYSIGLFVGDTEVERIFLQRPSVKIVNECLDVSGDRTLQCQSVLINGTYGVEVSIIV
jgi:hypothetical protein